MRRADRLFQIVQYLRGGRLTTAAKLAVQLEVSTRTIYRDIADLQGSGVPIDGEAGIGYLLREGHDLPPLMFARDELVALVAGARMVQAWGGANMAKAAVEALIKIEAVLPQDAKSQLKKIEVRSPNFCMQDADRERIDVIENAVESSQVLSFAYQDKGGTDTKRAIRPLGLWFWGGSWTVIGWCLKREAFRTFRIDRIGNLTMSGERFKQEQGKSLRDFYAMMQENGDLPADFDMKKAGLDL